MNKDTAHFSFFFYRNINSLDNGPGLPMHEMHKTMHEMMHSMLHTMMHKTHVHEMMHMHRVYKRHKRC